MNKNIIFFDKKPKNSKNMNFNKKNYQTIDLLQLEYV